jgi:ribonuclease H / adenosylcobalamin/alpha-ribazole phosphatase
VTSARQFIVEADGGSRGNPGPAAYGTVVRDAVSGDVLYEEGTTIGHQTNNVAEYRGLIAGLLAVRAIDPSGLVEARLDSKLVVEQMSGRWKIKHDGMRTLALQAREALPPSQVSYTWVPREKNKAADALVNSALDGSPVRRKSVATSPRPGPTDRERKQPPNVLAGWSETTSAMTTTLVLRHGETPHTASKRFSGWGGDNPSLSEIGRSQAQRAGQFVADNGGADLIVTSPMVRTIETAELVADSLKVPVVVEDGLRECAFGDWDGQTFAEVQQSDPEGITRWLTSTAEAPPGGESFDEVFGRVQAARDRLIDAHEGKTMVWVTHVTPLKTLVRLALDAPPHALYRMQVGAASISTIQWFSDGNACLQSFNDSSYL